MMHTEPKDVSIFSPASPNNRSSINNADISEEINQNSPSRSAKFRYAVRNKNKFIFPKELEIKFQNYLDLEKVNA